LRETVKHQYNQTKQGAFSSLRNVKHTFWLYSYTLDKVPKNTRIRFVKYLPRIINFQFKNGLIQILLMLQPSSSFEINCPWQSSGNQASGQLSYRFLQYHLQENLTSGVESASRCSLL